MAIQRQRFKHNIVAIVYDFDGTLTPQPMQEYTVLPEIGMKPEKFWNKVKQENKQQKGEEIITYMRLMLDCANQHHTPFPVKRSNLRKLAHKIKYYPGVPTYFNRINNYVKKKTNGKIHLRHYVISSGLKEILEKVTIKKKFHNIFASEYYYDHYGAAKFPLLVVNDTLKTQFLYRINKGKEHINESINEHMSLSQRPIPFQNILYIGDGLTDVPCMSVTNKEGGYAIAVYKRRSRSGLSKCKKLLNAGRVDFIATANYSNGSELERKIKLILDVIIEGVHINDAYFHEYLKYLKDKKRK